MKHRNKNINGKFEERFYELIVKPILIASIYFLGKLLLRIRTYKNDKPLSYRAQLFIDSSKKAVKGHNGLVYWIYPAFFTSLMLFFEMDNAYNVFWNKTLKIYYKELNKQKVKI